jgi:hypothetical protein
LLQGIHHSLYGQACRVAGALESNRTICVTLDLGEEGMENLARYIVRASFSQERMSYIPDESKVVYQSKDGKEEKVFEALEWLAAMCSNVPNKGEQMVRYYGYYSSVFH